MSTDEIVAWVHRFNPYDTVEECIEAYNTYQAYRSEGQSDIVSKQYAGLA